MYVAIIFIFRDFGKRISTLSIVDGNFSDFEKVTLIFCFSLNWDMSVK